MRRVRGQKGVKKDQVEIGRTRHSIGMRVDGKEASVYRGSNVFLHVSFSRYMGGRFLMLWTGQAELACLRSESFRLQHSQSFLFPDPKSQAVHESDLDCLYYPQLYIGI